MQKRHATHHKWLPVLAITLVFGILFLFPGKTQAAGKITEIPGWTCPFNEIDSGTRLPKNCTIQVELGNTVYLDSYLGVVQYAGGELLGAVGSSSKSGKAVYNSSKKSVASVGTKSGIVTTKKVGTTKITATYLKKNCVCTLKVVKKGTFTSAAKYAKLKKAIHTLVKLNKTKITSKNVSSFIKKGLDYEKLCKSAKSIDSNSGFLKGKNSNNTTKLLLAEAPIAQEVSNRLSGYCQNNNPINNGKLKIVSLKGSVGSKEINITLNRTVTKTDIHILQYCNKWNLKKLSDKKAAFSVNGISHIYSGSEPGSYSSIHNQGTCTLTCGSKKANIKINEKLEKNHKYTVYFRYGEESTFFPK